MAISYDEPDRDAVSFDLLAGRVASGGGRGEPISQGQRDYVEMFTEDFVAPRIARLCPADARERAKARAEAEANRASVGIVPGAARPSGHR